MFRDSEAAKQAAIFNALPARIVLLDAQGTVVSVNAAWRRYADEHSMRDPGYSIGLNYLTICDKTPWQDAPAARPLARGIRSVLNGSAKSFSVQYPCHSPTERHWYQLTATTMADIYHRGAVVIHTDVTAEKEIEEKLCASEFLFRQMAQSIRDVFFLRDPNEAGLLYVSPAYEQIWGRTCKSVYDDPASFLESVFPDDRAAVESAREEGRATGLFDVEYRVVRPDESVRWVEARAFPVHDDDGKLVRIASVARDITDAKEAEARIAYLHRLYIVLSGINTLIVRVRDQDELFRESCRIAVELGGFAVALMGIVDRGSMKIVSVALAGKDEALVAGIRKILSAVDGNINIMVEQALREKHAVVANDSQNDPRVAFRDKHVEFGCRSMVILPLIVADEAVGVIALYAGEIQFFHEEEMKLLTELSSDVSFAIERIGKDDRLAYLAYYDSITGLANRSLFLDRVSQHLRTAAAENRLLALGVLNVERFKSINESLGRAAGDALLKQVAGWLTQKFGDAHLLTRLGADHFAVLMPRVEHEEAVAHVLEDALDSLPATSFSLNDRALRIAVRAGVALYPDDGDSADLLLKNAEAALKKTKVGGERYLFYAQKMTETVAGRLNLENLLRQALDRKEFLLHYQPKVQLSSGKLTGAEALMRWNDPLKGLVQPRQFIPVLEETGLIYEVGRWALRTAIAESQRWRSAGLPAVRIAVNVSPLQLRNPAFVSHLREAIADDASAAAALELELTESLIMQDVEDTIAQLRMIRDMGVKITIDDFGTGFSSLSYLAKLPVDMIKIDRSFVTGMTDGPEGLALVSMIIGLARSLKIKVIAEGVETEEQANLLRLLNCDEMQGFLFSTPLPADVFETRYLAPQPRQATQPPH
jgi:diguanylate cyclase (GGDEF)-like protein/PAS domain S-box-containing protein